jgi:DNA integrity scanning protein DisA with diadenylate cyclase activity
MQRNQMAKGLLDEIEGTRAQLARRGRVLMMRVDEIATGMECEECQHLCKAYQRATIESIRLDEEVRSRNEYQSFRELIETTARAKAAEQLRVAARQKLAEHWVATGHG